MKQVFDVQSMSCNHCVKAITKAVQQLDPQARVQADLTHKTIEVESSQTREAIAQAIIDEGYPVGA